MVTAAERGVWGCVWDSVVGSREVCDCEHGGDWVPEAGKLDCCGHLVRKV